MNLGWYVIIGGIVSWFIGMFLAVIVGVKASSKHFLVQLGLFISTLATVTVLMGFLFLIHSWGISR